ncbi:helix-turn-helix domain-containing protein [Clostridium sp. UBA6640]|uniref:helix-turn-helix domain-containing protein n=1 Tax=Clostridium sp. UBA6640 TaxID=1946370 RepID=UPI0025C474E3|nr:helix-turn-helix domain-containing protein [Clostridium sp. UBA6640]
MSYTKIDNVVLNYNISDGAFKLHFLLQSMCYGDKLQCFPSQGYLANILRKSVRTIQRYLNELITAGIIKKQRRGSTSNLYTITLKVDPIEHQKNSFFKKNKNVKSKNIKAKKESLWNKIPSRNYNFDSLEKMLLGDIEFNNFNLYK